MSALLSFVGCGGDVLVGSTASSSSSAGGGGCQSHDDCPMGNLCNFLAGVCARACEDDCEACPTGEVCDPCGTSSCPNCRDCEPVCVPIAANTSECDDHSDCGDDALCIFEFDGTPNTCRPTCDATLCTDDKFCASDATLNERCGMVPLEACSP